MQAVDRELLVVPMEHVQKIAETQDVTTMIYAKKEKVVSAQIVNTFHKLHLHLQRAPVS